MRGCLFGGRVGAALGGSVLTVNVTKLSSFDLYGIPFVATTKASRPLGLDLYNKLGVVGVPFQTAPLEAFAVARKWYVARWLPGAFPSGHYGASYGPNVPGDGQRRWASVTSGVGNVGRRDVGRWRCWASTMSGVGDVGCLRLLASATSIVGEVDPRGRRASAMSGVGVVGPRRS